MARAYDGLEALRFVAVWHSPEKQGRRLLLDQQSAATGSLNIV